MKTLKPYLFTLFSLFLTLSVFLSCSKDRIENIDLNANQVSVETKTIENPNGITAIKPYSLEENVSKFSLEYVNISNRILAIFKENKKRMLDPSLKLKINSAKNLNQVFSILNNSKTEENEKLISLITKKMKLTTDFINENKSLRKLTKLQIENMLSEAFFKARVQSKTVKSTSKSAEIGECLQSFNNDVDRANNTADTAINAAVASGALADAASGGSGTPVVIFGFLIAAYTIDSDYENNITYAIADYIDCTQRNCSSKKAIIKY